MSFDDDNVILTDDEAKLQMLFEFTSEWYKKWRKKVNIDMTKVVHFKKKSTAETNASFYLGDEKIEKVDKYKYLGVYLDEHQTIANTLSGAAGRTLGSVISKFKNVGFQTYIFQKLGYL